MAYQAVPDTAHFKVIGQLSTGQEVVNDLYVRNLLLPWSLAHLAATGTIIGDIWRDDVVAAYLATSYTFDKVECTDLGVEFGNQTVVEYNTLGGNASPLTAALAMWVKFNGAGGSAPRSGGNFVGPFYEAAIDGDNWSATVTADIQIAYQDIAAALEAQANGDAHVIVSRFSKNEVPTPPHKRVEAVTNLIVSYDARELVATQRDRRTGEGS